MSENNLKSDSKNPGNADTSASTEVTLPTINPSEKWLIRDCELYKDEYDECTSIKARFHQYFIYGESIDCNQWKKDYLNCCKWVNDNDTKAGAAVIKSENIRRMQRLSAHYRNDTWKKRESPPDDWAKPLPEWMIKRDENTYLAQKAKEMREGTEEKSESSCVIM